MKKQELEDESAVTNKLLLYLKEDILRHASTGQFFKTGLNTFSSIVKAAGSEPGPERISKVFNDSLAKDILELIPTVSD